jgi:hypothetical protein
MRLYSDGYVEVSVKIGLEYLDYLAETTGTTASGELTAYIQQVLKKAVVNDMSEKAKRKVPPSRPLLYIIDDDMGW